MRFAFNNSVITVRRYISQNKMCTIRLCVFQHGKQLCRGLSLKTPPLPRHPKWNECKKSRLPWGHNIIHCVWAWVRVRYMCPCRNSQGERAHKSRWRAVRIFGFWTIGGRRREEFREENAILFLKVSARRRRFPANMYTSDIRRFFYSPKNKKTLVDPKITKRSKHCPLCYYMFASNKLW